MKVKVIGAGLAGSEAAYQLAKRGFEVELYEPIYGRMLIPGERSGNTDSVLSRLISLLAHSASSQLDNFINTIEPLLSGLLMLSIGIALLSLMLPLIGIMNSIG